MSHLMSFLRPAAFVAEVCFGTGGQSAQASDHLHPVVVEIFQSQGCSSCPPANSNVMALAARPDVLILSWQVTYWDYLGWKDTFAKPAFTDRQRDYAAAFGRTEVFTPEVVVNGREDVVGSQRSELEALIVRADRGSGGPSIMTAGTRITVSSSLKSFPHTALVELIRYDPRVLQVPIRRGENGGRTLPHLNVVRDVVTLGTYNGGVSTYDMPPHEDDLASAILVQMGRGGPILAARRVNPGNT
jgi:hypothetical protein